MMVHCMACKETLIYELELRLFWLLLQVPFVYQISYHHCNDTLVLGSLYIFADCLANFNICLI